MVRLHPGLLVAQIRQSEERLGLNPGVCGFDSALWAQRLGRQPADHLGLEPGMLWVRLPPEPQRRSSPRGAAWSARLPVTQEIAGPNPVEGADDTPGKAAKPKSWPSGGAEKQAWHGTQIGKAAKTTLRGGARTLVTAGSTPACATWRTCVGWAIGEPNGL